MAYLASAGYSVTAATAPPDDIARAEVNGLIDQRKEELRAEDIEAVELADDRMITVKEAVRIADGSGDVSKRAAAQRRLIREFYGEVSRDAIERDVDGEREAVRRWVAVAALLHGHGAGVADIDVGEIGVSAGTGDWTRRAIVQLAVLRAFRVDERAILGTAEGRRWMRPDEVREGEEGFFTGVAVDPDRAMYEAIWSWCSHPAIRDAVRDACGVDPWRQVKKAEQKAIIETLSGGPGVDPYSILTLLLAESLVSP